MTQVVYLDRIDDLGAKTVSTIGSQPGPIGGDGWVTLSEIPTSRLLAARHYAFWVTGKIGNFQRSGAAPVAGVVQLCLGTGAGTLHPLYLVEIGLGANLGPTDAVPFAFLLIFSSTISDPLFGATWPNTFPLQLFGRIYRRGDAANYSGSFDVTSLVWMWADLDAIPAGDQLTTRQTIGAPISTSSSPVPIAQSLNSIPGAAGDVWIHFWALSYRPGVGAIPAFQVGYVKDGAFTGFTPMNGTGGELGLDHRGTQTHGVQHQHGGFWVAPKVGAAYLPAIAGHARQTGAQDTVFDRFQCLSIRLTDLGNVHYSSNPVELALTTWSNNIGGPGSNYYPLEVPAEGRTWEPWTFATGIPDGPAPIDIWILDNQAFPLWVSFANQLIEDPLEGACCFAASSHGLGSGNPGVQYRLFFVENSPLPTFPRTVRDIYLVTFYPVKDPDNEPPDPNDVGDPVEIIPGTESLGVASLLDPPLAPNVDLTEMSLAVRERLRGATGYERSWTHWVATRRPFTLTWGPVSAAQRDALIEFFRAHKTFRLTPPQEGAVPAVVTTQLTWLSIDNLRFEVQLEAIELVYTGP